MGLRKVTRVPWWFGASREVSVWLCPLRMDDLGGCTAGWCVLRPSPTLCARELVTWCFCSPLHLVALQASKGLKGRAKAGPLRQTHGAGKWPLVRGSLEKVALGAGLEGS